MLAKTKGIVIKEQAVGESDRLVTILTADKGIIKAFVKKAKKINSSLNATTSLFAYCEFSLYKGKNAYNISLAEPIEMFFGLRNDLERLTLAQYIAELSNELLTDEETNDEILSLVLNSLYLLCQGKKDCLQIKAVFEIRVLSLTGYMPSLVACETCGTYESENMFFDPKEGKLYCEKCRIPGCCRFSLPALRAFRLICFSEKNKIFAFVLKQEDLLLLSEAAETYTLNIVGHEMGTLKFYKGLKYGQKF